MFNSVTLTEWLTIAAILLAPLVAIQVERYLAIIKERRGRKLNVFHTLMATRGARLTPAHVEALNRIDMDFYGMRVPFIRTYTSKADRDVLEAWRVYLDHLSTARTPENKDHWDETSHTQFTDLLAKMAAALNYHFDPVVLKKGGYYPIGYGDIEADLMAIRKSLRELLDGKQPLKVTIAQEDPLTPPSQLGRG